MTAPPQLSPRRRRLFRLLRLGIVVLVSILVVEAYLRRLPAPSAHEEKMYRIIDRDFVPRSSRKLRDYAYSQHKPEGVVRIACVGDSYTAGQGVRFEDAYPKRLERSLNDRCAKGRFEVMNGGIRGYNTRQEVGLVRSALRFRPDAVVVGFCLNDADVGHRGGVPPPDTHWVRQTPSPLARKLGEWSRLYKLLDGALRSAVITRRNVREVLARYDEDSYGWRICRGALGQIADMVRKEGARPILLIFPHFFGRRLHLNYPLRSLHEKVAREGRRLGYDVIDLLPAYDGIETVRLVAHPTLDMHPNEYAHRIAADVLRSELERLGVTGGCDAPPFDLRSPWSPAPEECPPGQR